MQCQKARGILNPFLEGDLAGPRAAEVEAHLASCPRCRAELEGLRRAVALVEGLPSLSPPPGLSSRVMARVLQLQPDLTPAAGSTLGWVLAAVLGGLGSLLLYNYVGDAGWPWDPAALDAVQPVGLEDLPSLLVGMEVGAVIGVTLLFVGLVSMLVQLIRREQQCQHG